MAKVNRGARLRLGVINTKMDKAIKAGIVGSFRRRHPLTKAFVFNEVSDGAQLRSKFSKRWTVSPFEQPGERSGKEGTQYVVTHDRVWKVLGVFNEDINPGGRHARRLLAVKLQHRKTGKILWLLNCHPDPLGAGVVKANPAARKNQYEQLLTFAEAVEYIHKTEPDAAIVLAGDTNQDVDSRLPKEFGRYSVVNILAEVGLRPAYQYDKTPGVVKLMEAFVSHEVDVLRRRGFHPRGFSDDVLDHEVVFVDAEF